MPRLRNNIQRNIPPHRPIKPLQKRPQTRLPAQTQHRHAQRLYLDRRIEVRLIHEAGSEIGKPRVQKPRFRDLGGVSGQVCLGNGFHARIRRVEEIPRQHLAHAAVDEKLRCVGDAEKGELPVRVQIPACRGLCRLLVAESGQGVFEQGNAFDQGRVLHGQGGGETNAFVVGDDVGVVDVQEIEDAFEILGGGLSGVVVVGWEGGVAAAAVVGGNDGVFLGEDGANGVPGKLRGWGYQYEAGERGDYGTMGVLRNAGASRGQEGEAGRSRGSGGGC